MAKDSITAQARAMVKENETRAAELFPKYNPLTGENAPGKRRELVLDDFFDGRALFLPLEMFSIGFIYQLNRAGSVEEFSYNVYGEYNEELRATIIEELLRLRGKYDFYFYSYAFVKIKNKDGGDDIPFLLRPAQIKLVKLFEKMRLAGKPIRVIMLKARQWGGSTCTQVYMSWIQIMWKKSWSSIIVGHQGDSAAEVKDMYIKLINQLPDFLFYELGEDYDSSKPKIKGGGTQNISLIPPRNCKIKTATAMNPEGARGGDSAMAHCTEVAFWPETDKMNPKKQIKSSCSGIPTKPLSVIVYESTANGQNFFKDEWDRAGQMDEYGEKVSAFEQLFVAWWEIEMYQEEPDDILQFAQMLLDRRAEQSGHWDYLYWLWTIGATLQGICWYRNKMREYDDIQDMQQEFPSNPVEAFKYSGQLEFDPYRVEQMNRYCKPPKFRGDIFGKTPKGESCLENLHLESSVTGDLKIWEYPDKSATQYSNRYFVSVDIGGAKRTSDFSVITVLDRIDMMLDDSGVLNEDAGPTVVASYTCHLDADLLAIKCAQIAHYYNDALLIVENNTAYSKFNDTQNDNQSELFFPILIPIYDHVYSKNQSETDKKAHQEQRWGFNTNRSTKVAIVKYMGQCIRDTLYIERERECTKEHSYYMKFPNNTYGAIPGKHDDRVMSRSIGVYVSRFEWDRYPVKRSRTAAERKKLIDNIRTKSSGAEVILKHH
jgi:hypothetical protein